MEGRGSWRGREKKREIFEFFHNLCTWKENIWKERANYFSGTLRSNQTDWKCEKQFPFIFIVCVCIRVYVTKCGHDTMNW